MIFASTRVLQEPTQAQETTSPGIWKIGMRDPLKDVRRQVPSGETKLVTNIDVSGHIIVRKEKKEKLFGSLVTELRSTR